MKNKSLPFQKKKDLLSWVTVKKMCLQHAIKCVKLLIHAWMKKLWGETLQNNAFFSETRMTTFVLTLVELHYKVKYILHTSSYVCFSLEFFFSSAPLCHVVCWLFPKGKVCVWVSLRENGVFAKTHGFFLTYH